MDYVIAMYRSTYPHTRYSFCFFDSGNRLEPDLATAAALVDRMSLIGPAETIYIVHQWDGESYDTPCGSDCSVCLDSVGPWVYAPFAPSALLDYLPAASGAVAPIAPVVPPTPSQATFEVRYGTLGTNRDDWTIYATYSNGKDAADLVKSLKDGNPDWYGKDGTYSLAIIKLEPLDYSLDWEARERGRLTDGTYSPLPGIWADRINNIRPLHFAHIATGDKRKIAFTETQEAGLRDKQKVLSAHEYANRHLQALDDDGRYQFIADITGQSTEVLFAPLGDADELQALYESCHESPFGVSSCMSHPQDDYSSHMHPVRVYAMGGDITLAYLTASGSNEDGNGNPEMHVAARCLVWPDRKQFGRIYGQFGTRLRTALQNLGYCSGNFYGAKIAKVEDSDEDNTFVMPYLDIGNRNVADMDHHFTVSDSGNICADRTDGLVKVYELVECDRCSNEYDPENSWSSVLIDEHESEHWCHRCFDNHSAYVSSVSSYVSWDALVEYRETGSRYSDQVPSWQLEENGGHLDGVLVDGVYWEDGFTCEDCGENFEPNDRALHGEDVCEDCRATRVESEAQAELDLSQAA